MDRCGVVHRTGRFWNLEVFAPSSLIRGFEICVESCDGRVGDAVKIREMD